MDAGTSGESTSQPLACDLRIALYQPDIAGNTGAILRLGACMGMGIELIGPAGFDMSDRTLKRAGMDYVAMAGLTRHVDWSVFRAWQQTGQRRLVLFTTRAATELWDFAFRPDDILLFGRESSGVPETVHEAADGAVLIPMPGGGRSLNLAMSAAIAAGEAMRQMRSTAIATG